MFESIDEALKLFLRLSKLGDVESKDYRSAVRYLKDNGYMVSPLGLKEDDTRWTYRDIKRRTFVMRSLRNGQNCDKCVDDELIKGWRVSSNKRDLLNKIKIREGTDKYLF